MEFFEYIRNSQTAEIDWFIERTVNLRPLKNEIENDYSLLDTIDSNFATALHHACRVAKLPLVQLLLSKGSCIEAQTKAGMTPLHFACEADSYQVAKELILRGASIHVTNKRYETPLELCSYSLRDELETFLSEDFPYRPLIHPQVEQRPPPPRPRAKKPHEVALEALKEGLAIKEAENEALRQEVKRITAKSKQEYASVVTQLDAARASCDTLTAKLREVTTELEEWKAGRKGADEVFQRSKPYVFCVPPVPTSATDVRQALPVTSSLFKLAANLCRSRGSFYPNPSPVAGFQLVKVEAVHSSDMKVAIFENYLTRMRRMREKVPSYNSDTSSLSPAQIRVLDTVRELYHDKAVDASPMDARTLYVFHGPKLSAVKDICVDGLDAVRSSDLGFFGAGPYSTVNIEYAARYARGDFDAMTVPPRSFQSTGGLVPVIMFAAAVGMAHPVTPEVDYPNRSSHSRFYNKPLLPGFDCHVACVSERAGYQAVAREHCQYAELVVANYQQLLPLAVLWLKPI